MKHVASLILAFLFTFCHAQQKSIDIDYTVTYLIPKRSSEKVDTVSVGFNKEGKYIWTDSKLLAKDLARSFFKNKDQLLNNAELSILLDTEALSLMLFFESGENQMYMNLELENFIPRIASQKETEKVELISEATGDTVEIIGRKVEMYEVYPSNKPDDSLYFGFDTSVAINNTKLFKSFLSLVLAAESKTEIDNFKMPNGLLMTISDEDETILTAHTIDTSKKILTHNYSFKITE